VEVKSGEDNVSKQKQVAGKQEADFHQKNAYL